MAEKKTAKDNRDAPVELPSAKALMQQIAEKHDLIRRHRRDRRQDRIERMDAAMNVTDGNQAACIHDEVSGSFVRVKCWQPRNP